jgi:hypothetical protein
MNASAPAQPAAAIPALVPYADLPARWGISVAREPGAVRVAVPPVPSWKHLGLAFHGSAAVLLAIVGGWLYAGFVLRAAPPDVVVLNAIIYSLPLLIIAAVAAVRLRRRVVLSVTRSSVAVGVLQGHGTGRWVTWPRAKVTQIKINPYNGKLLIRVSGEDLVERYIGPSREANQAVADALAAALRDVPVGEDESPGAPADPAALRTRRRVLIGTGVALLLTALGLLLMPFPFPVLAFYVLLASAVPFGILYGTQDKQFYV